MSAASEVLLATVVSDRTGVIAYFREMLAAGRYLYDAQHRYAHNTLVSQLFARQDETTTVEDADAELEEPLTLDRLLARVSEIGEILKDDEEGREFKEFLVELAARIARASGPLFGPRVTEDEVQFLADLKARLKVDVAGD